jgi:hypothetical protein
LAVYRRTFLGLLALRNQERLKGQRVPVAQPFLAMLPGETRKQACAIGAALAPFFPSVGARHAVPASNLCSCEWSLRLGSLQLYLTTARNCPLLSHLCGSVNSFV